MNQTAQDYDMMCRVGYGCGLETVEEAFSQLSTHYDAFFLISEAGTRLSHLSAYIYKLGGWGKTIRESMGDGWCDLQDAEEAAYWESQQ